MGRCAACVVAIGVAIGATSAGCRADLADWEVSRISDGMAILREQTQTLVVDQPLSLALSLQSHESNYYYAPSNVRAAVDHPGTLEVTVVGEVEIGMADVTQVDLRATQVGPNRVRFISDDTDEPLTLTFTMVAP
jgi:hypothetical protein